MYVRSTCKSQKLKSEPLALELQTVVSCYVGSANLSLFSVSVLVHSGNILGGKTDNLRSNRVNSQSPLNMEMHSME